MQIIAACWWVRYKVSIFDYNFSSWYHHHWLVLVVTLYKPTHVSFDLLMSSIVDELHTVTVSSWNLKSPDARRIYLKISVFRQKFYLRHLTSPDTEMRADIQCDNYNALSLITALMCNLNNTHLVYNIFFSKLISFTSAIRYQSFGFHILSLFIWNKPKPWMTVYMLYSHLSTPFSISSTAPTLPISIVVFCYERTVTIMSISCFHTDTMLQRSPLIRKSNRRQFTSSGFRHTFFVVVKLLACQIG